MRIAILGGGISGLTAAYECQKLGLDWHLYEATDRLGGIVSTTRIDEFVLENGPDAWVSEKPWLRELAAELGLEDKLIASNDATRKTYILIDGKLQPIPDGMRMMVPTDLAALEGSALFSAEAVAAYAAEPGRAAELREAAPNHDESVAAFVLRHFGSEVLDKIAAPLLSGVFGGDVHKLSVRSVMPQFVAMEREHGSLILALQAKAAARGPRPGQPIFTTFRDGMQTLIDAIVATLPTDRIHLESFAFPFRYDPNKWLVGTGEPQHLSRSGTNSDTMFDQLILATSLDNTRRSLLDPIAQELLPTDASSAVLAAFAWTPEAATSIHLPPGFGFLVPPQNSVISTGAQRSGETCSPAAKPSLLAATFVDQKFPHRAPAGARILRAFFGGPSAAALTPQSDHAIAAAALTQLRNILGPLPDPTHTTVARWPRSLPQYEVGHLDRMTQLDDLVACIGNLTLLGNAYRGVGLPDLIHRARTAVRELATHSS